ncbi:hypothetical protein E1286_44050 [Nonomuraea terrae]|uniref:Uncharacterized protein n=1 Tax=Nonomuraea terrae TaxID=2530383 RepID=A0A4R4XNA8_9ACTN|nr:glycoside hydrolase family 68 protein [Nonomuraea terrae]TDD32082.1 hypothetical protein E1286_44050 [Nonomuraea terrae]
MSSNDRMSSSTTPGTTSSSPPNATASTRPTAPTGLYGFAAPSLTGPYEPLNGSGLVIRNPAAEPDQAYAWLVLPDLHVVSFADYRSHQGRDLRHAKAAQARVDFGGTIAPMLKLTLDGMATSVIAASGRAHGNV